MFVTCSRGLIDADGWWIFSCGLPSVASCKLVVSHMVVGRIKPLRDDPELACLGKTIRKAWPVAGRGLAVHHRSSMFIRWKHETQPCQAFCLSLSNTLTLWDWTWDTGTRKTSLEVGVSVLHICAGVGPAFARPSTWCAPLHDRMQKWFFFESNSTDTRSARTVIWWISHNLQGECHRGPVKSICLSGHFDISGLIRPRFISLLGSSGADTPWTLLRRPTVMLCGWPTSAATKGGRPPKSVQSAQLTKARRPNKFGGWVGACWRTVFAYDSLIFFNILYPWHELVGDLDILDDLGLSRSRMHTVTLVLRLTVFSNSNPQQISVEYQCTHWRLAAAFTARPSGGGIPRCVEKPHFVSPSCVGRYLQMMNGICSFEQNSDSIWFWMGFPWVSCPSESSFAAMTLFWSTVCECSWNIFKSGSRCL